VHAFQSAVSADLLSFGGAGVSLMLGAKFTELSWLPDNDRAKMRPVYLLIVGLTDI
jgi:hypothetical protein